MPGLYQLAHSKIVHSSCPGKYLESRRQGSPYSALTRCMSGQGVYFPLWSCKSIPACPHITSKKSIHNLLQCDLQSLSGLNTTLGEFNSYLIKTMQSTGPQTFKDLLNNSIFISLSARYCSMRWSLVLIFGVREVFLLLHFLPLWVFALLTPLPLLCQLPFAANIQYKVICSKLLQKYGGLCFQKHILNRQVWF